jgi:hypothetical protein
LTKVNNEPEKIGSQAVGWAESKQNEPNTLLRKVGFRLNNSIADAKQTKSKGDSSLDLRNGNRTPMNKYIVNS